MSTVLQMFGLSTDFLRTYVPKAKGHFVAGAELEVESVRDYSQDWLCENAVQVTEDGSLRNNGKEFLLTPSRIEPLVSKFHRFHNECLVVGENPFSIRTSIHIHVNMMYSTDVQTKNLLFLYSIFEPLIFYFAGEVRKQNIHCVPLSFTHMPNYYSLDLGTIVSRWHKYTALNLLPLRDKGTVEFRHLGGTASTPRFRAWLKFIETLWTVAHKMEPFSAEMLMDLTFLKSVQKELMTPDFIANCETFPYYMVGDNLIDVKLAYC